MLPNHKAKHVTWPVLLVSLIILVLVAVPYVLAARAGGDEYVFGGFLLNPVDGNTYLSKMMQGWSGEWRMSLPYAAEPGDGAYLFLFYLFLGHVARGLNLPLLAIFHAARLLSAALMLAALYRFLGRVSPEWQGVRLAFTLAALGSGLGWLAIPFGVFTSDFWVAEAFPFLSAYANPHFPLGLALLLWILTPKEEDGAANFRWKWAGIAFAALLLSIISPFGVVIALAVLGGVSAWEAARSRPGRPGISIEHPARAALLGENGTRFLAVLLGGGPYLLYSFWVANTDPVLAAWNAQNLTPSPPLWDLLVSFAPVLLLALPGARAAARRNCPGDRLLLSWAALGLLLMYLPWSLQRRFILGLYVPLAGLAVIGIQDVTWRLKRFKALPAAILLVALPTNLIVLLAAFQAIQTHEAAIYLTQPEGQALGWLGKNTPEHALVLAAPETGLLIPAYTGRRVIYGHPFETPHADAERRAVEDYFASGGIPGLPAARRVDYVFFGPREAALAAHFDAPGLEVVYAAAGVNIYKVIR